MSELMTAEELGKYLRFSRKTLYRLLKEGKIPAIKIGDKWRFDKAAIDRWIHQDIWEKRARILVIDDDDQIRFLFKNTLENQGHTVVTASNGAQGIARVIRSNFDMVFLDLRMPQIDGAQFLKQVKTYNPTLPVVIITGFPGGEIMEKALKEGPITVMDKPFTGSDIIDTVNSFSKAGQF